MRKRNFACFLHLFFFSRPWSWTENLWFLPLLSAHHHPGTGSLVHAKKRDLLLQLHSDTPHPPESILVEVTKKLRIFRGDSICWQRPRWPAKELSLHGTQNWNPQKSFVPSGQPQKIFLRFLFAFSFLCKYNSGETVFSHLYSLHLPPIIVLFSVCLVTVWTDTDVLDVKNKYQLTLALLSNWQLSALNSRKISFLIKYTAEYKRAKHKGCFSCYHLLNSTKQIPEIMKSTTLAVLRIPDVRKK